MILRVDTPGKTRALLALLALLLVPRSIGEGLLVDALALGGAVLYLATHARWTKLGILSGTLVLATWTLAPAAYPAAGFGFLLLVLFGHALGRTQRRAALFALAPALLPLVLIAFAWAFGGEVGRETLRHDLRLPSPSLDAVSTAVRLLCAIVVAWLALGATPSEAMSRGLVQAALPAVLVLVATRSWVLASTVTLPGDAQWSEPPILLNLLKLDVGAPLYGPFEDCNSYSYSPALETVQRLLLRPFGLGLSLVAHRMLGFVWQGVTAAVLYMTVRSSFTHARLLAALATLLVATSSFLAANLHPDHLLMPWFALALLVALHAKRLSPKTRFVALLLVPPICVVVKLTGAGIGVGLALALVWPGNAGERRRAALALSGGAALAGLSLFALERGLPGFLKWTLGLQASHAIRWRDLANVPLEDPGRLLLIALVALAFAFAAGDRMRDARGDAGRALLVTLGFALPSLVAYVKVGGRVNSLLPLTIGGAVALARLAKEARSLHEAGPLLTKMLLLWSVLTVTPRSEVATTELRAAVVERHRNAVALVRTERAAGRRTLFYEGTAVWIDASARDIPLDRSQTVGELVRGHHPEVEAHFARLESGFYETLILSDAVLDARHFDLADRLREILARHYRVVQDQEVAGAALPPFRAYRWVE